MVLNDRIDIIKGDITQIAVDVVVNAANSSLRGGGGVDGAIHRAGGPRILQECMELVALQGPCQPGDAVITSAGALPARYVIHTVGPLWEGGMKNEDDVLRRCYRNCLELAVRHEVETIAFPNISTGVFGFPKKEAADIAFATVLEFLQKDESLTTVYFVCFDEDNYALYKKLYNESSNNQDTPFLKG